MFYFLDELTVHPGKLQSFLAGYKERYIPGAQARGLTLVGTWVTPPVEVDGEPYRIINKKTYAKVGVTPEGREKHAKGLNVRRLTDADFQAWFNGTIPFQMQLQKQNFVKVMTGFDMFITRPKHGEVEGRTTI